MAADRGGAVALAMATGLLADRCLADPARGHPVAGFGRFAAAVERHMWRPTRAAGVGYLLLTVGPCLATAAAVDRRLDPHRNGRVAYLAALTWASIGATSLHRAASDVERALAGGDVDGGRRLLSALCGRDPADLDEIGLRRAVVESVADNTCDAIVAPLLWAVAAGPAGLVGYRAVNTLDAMVGHRSERYEQFGWAAARADDVMNLLPAGLTAALAVALAPVVRGRFWVALATWWRDAAAHPSPNAGRCEAAFAGALGLRLGGPLTYSYGRSDRPWLGAGSPPEAGDVDRAIALSRAVTACAAALCIAMVMIGVGP